MRPGHSPTTDDESCHSSNNFLSLFLNKLARFQRCVAYILRTMQAVLYMNCVLFDIRVVCCDLGELSLHICWQTTRLAVFISINAEHMHFHCYMNCVWW